jgi:hypothetical protein
MSLPNAVPGSYEEFINGISVYYGIPQRHENAYTELALLRSDAIDMLERVEDSLRRAEVLRKRVRTPVLLDDLSLEDYMFLLCYSQRYLTRHVLDFPGFESECDDARLRLCRNLRMELNGAAVNIKNIDDILDAHPPSVLDRLRAVRDDVGRALSSFARRFVPRARGTVVPFDGPS